MSTDISDGISDPCLSAPCKNEATCSYEEGDKNVTCMCKPKYTGVYCELGKSAMHMVTTRQKLKISVKS